MKVCRLLFVLSILYTAYGKSRQNFENNSEEFIEKDSKDFKIQRHIYRERTVKESDNQNDYVRHRYRKPSYKKLFMKRDLLESSVSNESNYETSDSEEKSTDKKEKRKVGERSEFNLHEDGSDESDTREPYNSRQSTYSEKLFKKIKRSKYWKQRVTYNENDNSDEDKSNSHKNYSEDALNKSSEGNEDEDETILRKITESNEDETIEEKNVERERNRKHKESIKNQIKSRNFHLDDRNEASRHSVRNGVARNSQNSNINRILKDTIYKTWSEMDTAIKLLLIDNYRFTRRALIEEILNNADLSQRQITRLENQLSSLNRILKREVLQTVRISKIQYKTEISKTKVDKQKAYEVEQLYISKLREQVDTKIAVFKKNVAFAIQQFHLDLKPVINYTTTQSTVTPEPTPEIPFDPVYESTPTTNVATNTPNNEIPFEPVYESTSTASNQVTSELAVTNTASIGHVDLGNVIVNTLTEIDDDSNAGNSTNEGTGSYRTQSLNLNNQSHYITANNENSGRSLSTKDILSNIILKTTNSPSSTEDNSLTKDKVTTNENKINTTFNNNVNTDQFAGKIDSNNLGTTKNHKLSQQDLLVTVEELKRENIFNHPNTDELSDNTKTIINKKTKQYNGNSSHENITVPTIGKVFDVLVIENATDKEVIQNLNDNQFDKTVLSPSIILKFSSESEINKDSNKVTLTDNASKRNFNIEDSQTTDSVQRETEVIDDTVVTDSIMIKKIIYLKPKQDTIHNVSNSFKAEGKSHQDVKENLFNRQVDNDSTNLNDIKSIDKNNWSAIKNDNIDIETQESQLGEVSNDGYPNINESIIASEAFNGDTTSNEENKEEHTNKITESATDNQNILQVRQIKDNQSNNMKGTETIQSEQIEFLTVGYRTTSESNNIISSVSNPTYTESTTDNQNVIIDIIKNRPNVNPSLQSNILEQKPKVGSIEGTSDFPTLYTKGQDINVWAAETTDIQKNISTAIEQELLNQDHVGIENKENDNSANIETETERINKIEIDFDIIANPEFKTQGTIETVSDSDPSLDTVIDNQKLTAVPRFVTFSSVDINSGLVSDNPKLSTIPEFVTSPRADIISNIVTGNEELTKPPEFVSLSSADISLDSVNDKQELTTIPEYETSSVLNNIDTTVLKLKNDDTSNDSVSTSTVLPIETTTKNILVNEKEESSIINAWPGIPNECLSLFLSSDGSVLKSISPDSKILNSKINDLCTSLAQTIIQLNNPI